MPFEVLYDQPYLETTAAPPTGFPQAIDIVIGGHSYVANTSFEPYRRDAFRHRSIQAQRESISLDNLPGEGTVNTEGLWRREAWDWHLGAGQPYQDRKDSLDGRFSISKGVNPWLQWQLSLLNDTSLILPILGDARVKQVGAYVYVLDLEAQTVQYSSNLANWTELATGLTDLSGMATDGYNVWISSSTGINSPGLVQSTAGSSTVKVYAGSQPFDGVYYVGDRLMTTYQNNVYNLVVATGEILIGGLTTALVNGTPITSIVIDTALVQDLPSGSAVNVGPVFSGGAHNQTFFTSTDSPAGSTTLTVTSLNANFDYPIGTRVTADFPVSSPLWTHPTSAFIFTSMDDGSSQIYMSGYVAGSGVPLESTVYRTTIEATGTALTIPVQALPMEGGEYATSLYGYLNFIFVGSNLGVRMCRTIAAYDPTGNEGDLEAGPLLPGLFPPGPVNSPVFSMVGNNRFVYFGWNNYDNVSTGLGRCDLSTFIDTQAPAFASDLMVTGEGFVTSMDWCTINNSPVFVVEDKGVYVGAPHPVAEGYVQSGNIGYGISDDKILWAGDIGTVQPQVGTVTMSIAVDGAVQTVVGVQSASAAGGSAIQSPFAINQVRGDQTIVQMNLSSGAGQSPILHRWTLKALPAITAGTTISAVILLYDTVNERGGDIYNESYAEYKYLYNLRNTQTLVTYQEGPFSANCVIDELDWLPFKEKDSNTIGGFIGDLIVYLKTVDIGA